MSPRRLLFQLASTYNPTPRVGLVQRAPHDHFIEKSTCSRHDIAKKLLSWRYTTTINLEVTVPPPPPKYNYTKILTKERQLLQQ